MACARRRAALGDEEHQAVKIDHRVIRGLFLAVAGVLGCAVAHGQGAGGGAAPAPGAPVVPDVVLTVTPITQMEVRGHGPIPMVLIPAIGCDWTVWSSFMDRNLERYTMYAVTLPGMNGTSAPDLPEGKSWEDMVLSENALNALLYLIISRDIDRPFLVGHGYGGVLAMRLALQEPDLVRGVVSVDGMPSTPMADPGMNPTLEERKEMLRRSTARELMSDTDERWRAKQFTNTLHLVADDRRAQQIAIMFNRTVRGVLIFYYLESLLVDLRQDLQGLRVPLLCIAPIKPDPPPPPAVVRDAWSRALGAPPNTSLVFYGDCHHFVMDDNPAQLDFDLDLFTRGLPVPGAMTSVPRDPDAPAMPSTQR